MNNEDVEELTSFEQQLHDITKKINLDDDDENDIWKKNSYSSHSRPQNELKFLSDFSCLPRHPLSPGNDGRISPEGSSSSTHSLNKTERTQESSLMHCKPLDFKSFPKGSYTGSQANGDNIDSNKSGGKTSLVQNWERLKDLSFHNRPSVLQLTNLWNTSDGSNKMLSAHRSAIDSKREPVSVRGGGGGGGVGGGNLSVKPQSPITKTFDDTPLVKDWKDSRFTAANGYHSDQSGTLRRLPDLGYSKLQNSGSLLLGKSSTDSDPSSSSNLKSFRDRGTSADRSFHLSSGFSRRNADYTTGGKSGKPIQMSRWVFSRAGRDPLQKTSSLDSSDGSQGSGVGGVVGGPGLSPPGRLLRATSLSKFDDDDEFLLSPPTAVSAHSSKLSTGTRFGSNNAFSFAGGSPVDLERTGATTFPAFSTGLSLLGNRSGYCFAHGGSNASTPTGIGGSTPKSPINGPMSSPYATLRLHTGRAKSLTRKEAGCMSPHQSSSIPISPSSRLAEDIQANEIRRLRQDLQWAKEQVALLTSRLSTNANVVQAFDQSMSNIAFRLQQLSSNAQQKKTGELAELLATVQSLRRQNLGQSSTAENSGIQFSGTEISARSSSLCDEPTSGAVGGQRTQICRQPSSDSVTSLTSSAASVFSSVSQPTSAAEPQPLSKKKTVKNWLRSSFGKAFSRKKSNNDQKSRPGSESSVPSSAPVLHANSMPSIPYSGSNGQLSYTESAASEFCPVHQHHLHQHQHHLHQHKPFSSVSPVCNQGGGGSGTVCQMYHRHPSGSDSVSSCQGSFPVPLTGQKKDGSSLSGPLNLPYGCSMAAAANHKRSDSLDQTTKTVKPNCLGVLLKDRPLKDGHKITVCVEMSGRTEFGKQNSEKEIVIGSLTVGDKTSWDLLDGLVRRVFQEHLIRLDPATSLGLTGESVYNYRVGEITRWKDSKAPELLPIGYLVGDIRNVIITLRGNREGSVDLLAFETLIPKSILHRYLKLLLEHRRIILSGSTGTGKTYLAQRLAECLLTRSGSDKTGTDAVAIFRVDSQSSKELRQYLTNMADQCERGSDRLPIVVILDNLHHVTSLSDVFNAFLETSYQNSPYIIGTMNQATCSSTDLQLHHNFRWVLYANHIEPVRSFLGRYLRRQLVYKEVTAGCVNPELNKVIEWLPKVWQHINKFLETHSSCDITIGPRLFLLCPMDVSQAQVWFTDLWNYSIVPYLLEAVREGIQTYGCRAPWEDLADWVIDSYPWNKGTSKPVLLHLRPEDVGYETKTAAPGDKATSVDRPTEADIMTLLQEAAKQSDSDDTNNDTGADLSQVESSKSTEDEQNDLLITDDVSSSSSNCRTSVI